MALMDLFLGPVLLGIVLNIWLYGIMVSQTATYYVTFPRDRKWLKAMVGGIFLIDTLNSIFNIGIVWRYTITLFGDLPGISTSHWSFHIEPVMTVMISSTTQCFFAWRIAKLTGQVWLGWLIALSSLIQFLCGTGSTIGGFIVRDFARFHELKVPIVTWLGLSAVTDILITVIISWFLLTHRTGISRTDDIISRVVRLTVQNGLVTTIWATMNLITYLTLDSTGNLYMFFQLPLCKLYTNTILSTLNCRAGWGIDLSSGTSDPFSKSGDVAACTGPMVWHPGQAESHPHATTQAFATASPYLMDKTKTFSLTDEESGPHS